MPSTTQVTCDGCGKDITYTGNCVDYRLILGNESLPPRPGSQTVTAMMIYPPVNGTHYFCGLGCLDHWTDRRRHYEAASRRYHEENQGGATFIFVPGGKPNETTERFKAEALAAFPMKHPLPEPPK